MKFLLYLFLAVLIISCQKDTEETLTLEDGYVDSRCVPTCDGYNLTITENVWTTFWCYSFSGVVSSSGCAPWLEHNGNVVSLTPVFGGYSFTVQGCLTQQNNSHCLKFLGSSDVSNTQGDWGVCESPMIKWQGNPIANSLQPESKITL